MVYTGIIEREDSITIDGYCKAKTINGAIKEFGRYIRDNISESEGNYMIDLKEDALCNISQWDSENGIISYFFTIEEVPCASRLNEKTDEIEHKESNYYACVRIIKGGK